MLLSKDSLQRSVVHSNYCSVLKVLGSRTPRSSQGLFSLHGRGPQRDDSQFGRFILGGSLLRDLFTFFIGAVESRLTGLLTDALCMSSSVSNHNVRNSPTVVHAG